MISKDAGRATVRVIRTDGELVIAKVVCRTIDLKVERGKEHESDKPR